MADRSEESRGEHPVLAGLLALIGVALVVGLILGLGALAGAKMLGVGEESASSNDASGEATLYLPKPEKTTPAEGPEVTLAPGESASVAPGPDPSESETTAKPDKPISLSASQTSVAPMEQIDLTGVYPGGEGAILQVQRFEGGSWQDFPASPVSVSNQTFATYVQTGQPGPQRFRMLDTETGKASNEVTVTVE